MNEQEIISDGEQYGLTYKTDVFEGPLDLLLALIRKNKLNIRDIQISVLLDQFLEYLENMRDSGIEIAGEFLEMAARLICIKTNALLPRHEIEEMERQLVGALIDYSLCKEAAVRLYGGYLGGSVFTRKPDDIEIDTKYPHFHDVYELESVLRTVLKKELQRQREEREPRENHTPQMKQISDFTKVVYVLRRVLAAVLKGETVRVDALYVGQKRAEQAAVCWALIDLSRSKHIEFDENYSHIYRKKV